MPFSDFHGNPEIVHRLRDMLAREPLSSCRRAAGGHGSGKYTLALMLAQALNCLSPTQTAVCPTSAASAPTASASPRPPISTLASPKPSRRARISARPTRKKPASLCRRTPDVLVIPPDPPQMMIKVDQVRRVIETIYYRPAEGRERIYIFHRFGFHERGSELAPQGTGRTSGIRDHLSAD